VSGLHFVGFVLMAFWALPAVGFYLLGKRAARGIYKPALEKAEAELSRLRAAPLSGIGALSLQEMQNQAAQRAYSQAAQAQSHYRLEHPLGCGLGMGNTEQLVRGQNRQGGSS